VSAFSARDIKPLIGSEVRADPADLVAGVHAAELRELLVTRGVLVFRGLKITTDQQRAITATIGALVAQDDDEGADGGLQKVTIDPAVSAEYAAYFANTLFWHMDGYHGQRVPVFGGSFRPERLAPEGGGTEFLNAYAAYEGLSQADRELVDTLTGEYSALVIGLAANPDASDAQVEAWRNRPRARQPLVWEHASGRKSLMVGAAVSHVVGMAPADSYDLLLRLRAHFTRPEYIYSHEWRPDDLIIWNNTGTMHRARPFDPSCGRLLHRFTIAGDEPIRAPSQAPCAS